MTFTLLPLYPASSKLEIDSLLDDLVTHFLYFWWRRIRAI